MVSLSMTLSDPWPGFQGHGSFKRRISPKQRILQTQLLYRTLIANHRQAIDRQAYSLQPHCCYINRANVSQASRGFVSNSWPFLLQKLQGSPRVRLRGTHSMETAEKWKINVCEIMISDMNRQQRVRRCLSRRRWSECSPVAPNLLASMAVVRLFPSFPRKLSNTSP